MKPEVKTRELFSFSTLAIPISFVLVLIIWTTTPLAIKWSSAGAPMTSALLRMLIGVTFCGSIVIFMSSKFRVDAAARKVYLVGGLSIFVCMSLFYAAAQLIPSGWIAVLFGLSPLTTGLFSALVEPETRLTPTRLFGLSLGLGGLYLVFSAGLNLADASIEGVILTLIAVLISSATSVITRQLVKDLDLPGMQITTGSLIVAIPFFVVAAVLLEPELSLSFSFSFTNLSFTSLNFTNRAWSAILYLGLIGTGVGFTLYYYLLKHVSASRIALITLVTPISALSVGSWLNNEPLVPEVWMGAALVCIGLLLYEFKPKLGLRKL
jgi:drug/metabolite transporter (DMT)-like permease